MSQHGRALVLLLLVVLGAVMGYVSPDDHGRSKSGDRLRVEQSPPGQGVRQRPQPLSANDQQRLEQARKGPGAAARKARDIDTGSGSGSGFASAGSGSYAGTSGGAGQVGGASFGYPGFQANPFMQGGSNLPFDFNGFFQQLQQIQHSIGQYALNQAAITQYQNAGNSGSFGGGDLGSNNLDDLLSKLPAFITLTNGTKMPISVLLAALSSPQLTSSEHHQANSGGAGYGAGFDPNVAYNQLGNNYEGASASASLGPNGGHGSAQLIPGLTNRFGDQGGESVQSGQFPAPSGGNFGVFSSSSAGSSDVNGQRQTFKTATSGVNDNGKITTFTVSDPPK